MCITSGKVLSVKRTLLDSSRLSHIIHEFRTLGRILQTPLSIVCCIQFWIDLSSYEFRRNTWTASYGFRPKGRILTTLKEQTDTAVQLLSSGIGVKG